MVIIIDQAIIILYTIGGIGLSELKFPSYYPEGCPPAGARFDRITAYRCCKSRDVSPEDFVPLRFTSKSDFTGLLLMMSYGVSVYPSIESCKQALDKSPKLRGKTSCIACGEIDENKGKILETPSRFSSSHITWWVYEGVQPHTFFHVIQDL